MKRNYHTFFGGAAVTMAGFVAVTIVSGGWQPAVAAALAMFGGLVFGASFVALAAAGERPRPTRPGWARETARPGALPARRDASAPAAERAPVPSARGRLSSSAAT